MFRQDGEDLPPKSIPRIETDDSETVVTTVPEATPAATIDTAAATSTQGDETPDQPPAYGEHLGEIDNVQEGAHAYVAQDGRINIRIDQKSKGLNSLLIPALRSSLDVSLLGAPPPYEPPRQDGDLRRPPPPMSIVIQVVGSRGDVQPFVALGKALKTYGHRIRLATHAVFKTFVEENDLEFFNIGGDPSELMAFMVKNPGLMPGFESLRRGDVGKRRREIAEMINGCWRSCIEAGDGMEACSDPLESIDQVIDSNQDPPKPFVADAIIANPPSFAHIHCAEKLGIPLHMMFTMPWSPTQSFPHPLANIQSTTADEKMTNFMSYALVDMMTWQGLGDMINRFRQKTLGLGSLSLAWAPGMLARLRIPWTYCWSPALIPKPRDWAPNITCSGFYFLPLGQNYVPDTELSDFLAAGPPPVYIGFGSIVVDDPNAMTTMIFEAVKQSGQRALVSKGWGGIGADELGIPEGVYMLGNVPHDWLFQHVSCVVHHGGAGTTAAGIAAGKPTVIVPFFGDQPFWGAMVARAGAGPQPVPYKQLTAESLAASIKEALSPEMQTKADQMCDKISHERGTVTGAQHFHRELDVDKMRCHLSPNRVAVWRIKRTDIRLSAFAATVLTEQKLLQLSDMKLYRPREYHTEDDPWDPVTGGASALLGTMGSMMMGVADLPVAALKAFKIHPDSQGRSRASSSANKSPARSRSGTMRSDSPRSHANTLQDFDGPGSKHLNSPPLSPRGISPAPTGEKLETPSPGRGRSTSSVSRVRSSSGASQFGVDDAYSTGKSTARILGAGFKSPMDFTLAIAKGFHNAPKLYGDTVREHDKVTDLASGLKAAGKEFAYGIGDGIAGLFTQPIQGAKKEGASGFAKGFGRGIGGLILKPSAAIWGLPGYTFRGIYMELQKAFGPSTEIYVLAARTAQGYDDMQQASQPERDAVVENYRELRRFIYKKKGPGEEQREELQRRMNEKMERAIMAARSGPMSPLARNLQRTITTSTTGTTGTMDSGNYSPDESEVITNPLSRSHTFNNERQMPERPEVEEAIRRSIVETSRGDSEEDAQIERAIRESVAELNRKRAEGADDEEIQRAMQASVEDAQKGIWKDDDLEKAITNSMQTHAESNEEAQRAKKEEEIVMNYIMKQSAAEEELRKANPKDSS